MSDDKTITLTLAELRAVAKAGICTAQDCSRLATQRHVRLPKLVRCDLHSQSFESPKLLTDADLIRTVQARIDGLSAQDDAWGIARFVSAHGLVSSVRGPYAFASKKDAERYAKTFLDDGTYSVVRL